MNSIKRGFKIRKSARRAPTQENNQKQDVYNLEDLRLADSEDTTRKQHQNQKSVNTIVRKHYDNSQDQISCYRFPHLKFCGCEANCLFEAYEVFSIVPNIYICGFISGCKTRSLLQSGITHVLNITSKQYTKRNNFFKYLNIDIHNNTEEDIKKFFRITNRYIQESIQQGGTVLIHSCFLELAACFAVSYLIGIKRMPIKVCMEYVRKTLPKLQITSHFYKQLENYDLEKLAFVTIKRESD